MPASEFARALDRIQRALRPSLQEHGFKLRGRTFNRVTDDGLTHVVNLQIGASDAPGTMRIPGLREHLHGLFTVNLGIYIPEVAALQGGGLARSWIQDYHCSIRTRLGPASGSPGDLWWHAQNSCEVISDVQPRLLSYGLAFLERFSTRNLVLSELNDKGRNLEYCAVPRIVSAIILAERGLKDAARTLLIAQTQEALNRSHSAYVRALALRMGLGAIGV